MKKLPFVIICFFSTILIISAQVWNFDSVLPSPDPNYLGNYGYSLAKDGDYLVVGAPKYESNEDSSLSIGAAYIYHKNTFGNFEEAYRINGPDTLASTHFGWSVDIEGNTMVVSAPHEPYIGSNEYIPWAGAVYIYDIISPTEFNFIHKLYPSDYSEFQEFGSSVDLGEDYLIVGSSGEYQFSGGFEYPVSSGAAYIFKKQMNGEWEEVQKITPPERKAYAHFGEVVKRQDDIIMISAPGEAINYDVSKSLSVAEPGTVYLYKKGPEDQWNLENEFNADYTDKYTGFGQSLSIDGNQAVIGAPYETDSFHESSSVQTGVIYYLELNLSGNLEIKSKIHSSDGISHQNFGQNVCLKDNILAQCSPRLNDNKGIISVYKMNENGFWYKDPEIKFPELEGDISMTSSLLMDSTHLYIGGANSNLSGVNEFSGSGAVYLYRKPSFQILPAEKIDITIYPNPTQDLANIYFSEGANIPIIQVVDQNGKILSNYFYLSSDINFLTVKLPDIPGTYFLKIEDTKGLKIVRKIIKI
jgi:hypothetical protein